MSLNPVKMIYDFNRKAGLLEKGYSDEKECAFPIEEALEGFNCTELIAQLDLDRRDEVHPKYISRRIIDLTVNDDISDVDRLDKHLDIIVFSFGSIFKLGLTPQQAIRALEIVMRANLQKLHNKSVDAAGKLTKPTDFVGPEVELQRILDERG